MSTSIPVRIRNGASSSFSALTRSSCWRSRSADSPLATVSRGEWSVSAIHSWPRSRAATAISRGGLPPSDQSEWVWQSPRSAARIAVCSGGVASPNSLVRYSGSWPADAWAMTWAVAGPIPRSSCSVPLATRASSSPAGSRSATLAAPRNAFTR